jgi:hypothetical protein
MNYENLEKSVAYHIFSGVAWCLYVWMAFCFVMAFVMVLR